MIFKTSIKNNWDLIKNLLISTYKCNFDLHIEKIILKYWIPFIDIWLEFMVITLLICSCLASF